MTESRMQGVNYARRRFHLIIEPTRPRRAGAEDCPEFVSVHKTSERNKRAQMSYETENRFIQSGTLIGEAFNEFRAFLMRSIVEAFCV